MKQIILLLALGVAFELRAAPTVKNLVKEAQQLEQAAATASDPQKATELRRSSCNKWQEAYDADKNPDYLFSVGICRTKVQELDTAETVFRAFLAQAPATHNGRPAAEQAIEQIRAERKIKEEETTPQALMVNKPLPTEDSPHQWRKRLLLAGGSLGALGIVGGAIAFSVLRSQDDFSRGSIVAVEQ